MITNCYTTELASEEFLTDPYWSNYTKYCFKILTGNTDELTIGAVSFDFTSTYILTPSPVVLPVFITNIIYTDGYNFYFNNAPNRDVYGVILKDNNGELITLDTIQTPEGEFCIITEEPAVITEEQAAINCFEGKLQEKQLEFVSDVSNYVKKLNLGSFCCKELNKLIIDKKKLEILNCYDTRDIYNCSEEIITFNETQYDYLVGLDYDANINGRIYIDSNLSQLITRITINNQDLNNNYATVFQPGQLIRIQQDLNYASFLILDVVAISGGYDYTVINILSFYSNTLNIADGLCKISKINTTSGDFFNLIAGAPNTVGRFQTIPTASPTVVTTNITELRINKTSLYGGINTWLPQVVPGDWIFVCLPAPISGISAFAMFYVNTVTDYTNYIKFVGNTPVGLGNFGGIEGAEYLIYKTTSTMTTTPSVCTQDTTDYNNFTYTEINNLLNS